MIDETADEIASMGTHSSSEVSVKAARALTELCEREYATVEEFERDLERNASALRRANPSHASLSNVLQDVKDLVGLGEHDDVAAAQSALETAVEDVITEIVGSKDEAAANAASLLDDGDVVVTHAFSTTVLSAIEIATEAGAKLDVYVTEARPRCLGRRTARRLADFEAVDCTLVVDGASGHVLSNADRVLTGVTCIAGDRLYNRIGTYPLFATAAQAGVPTAVAGSSAKLVGENFVFENDERDPVEVIREPLEGFAVENRAYDATPVELVDQIATDEGIREP